MKQLSRLPKFLILALLTLAVMLNLTSSLATLPAQAAIPSDLMPPIVVSSLPEAGFEQPLNEPITLKFDQPMDRASVEKSFAIEPGAAADGTLTWLDDQTMTFQFKAGFKRGERYRVRLLETAQSQKATPMNRPFELRFSAVGFLEVAKVSPADGDIEILADTTVTVAFNRPVVALQGISQTTTANIIEFTPLVAGTGAWLNTSIYQFTPSGEGFKPATAYTAQIAGLSDVSGMAELAEAYRWQFNTITPAAIGSLPAEADLYVSPTPVITIAFNQAMNRASVEQNLQLMATKTGKPVTLTDFKWRNGSMVLVQLDKNGNYLTKEGYYDTWTGGPTELGVETVTFRPSEPLQLETAYRVTLPSGTAGKLAGARTATDYEANFTTTPAPKVVSTTPENGEDFVETMWFISIEFNAPMSPESVVLGKNLTLEYGVDGEPAAMLTATQVYSSWGNENKSLSLNIPAQYNTNYTMTLSNKITGRYGQPLSPTVVTWKTLRKAAAIRFLSPRVGMYNGYDSPRLYLTLRNMNKVNFKLARLSWADFLKLAVGDWYNNWQSYKANPKQVVRQWSLEAQPEAYKNYVYEVGLTEKETETLEPGIYYLEGLPAEGAIFPDAQGESFDNSEARVLLLVSKYNVTFKSSNNSVLAWVTDLQTGQPVADVPITFMAQPSEGAMQKLGEVKSDAQGVAFLKHSGVSNGYSSYLAVTSPRDKLGADFALSLSDWQDGINRYDFKGVNVEDWLQPYNGHLYTDRNIYRAGQTINFKGIVRADNDTKYSLPPATKNVKVQIMDGQSNTVYEEMLPLNSQGSFDDSFVLSEGAGLGGYSIQANLDDKWYSYSSFNVAAYRKPEFLVSVATDKAEYAHNDPIKVTASAEFFAGGALSVAAVRWTVIANDYIFNYQGAGQYDFVDADPFSMSDYNGMFGQEIASGVGVTDNAGRFTFDLPADITANRNSQEYTIEATVTGLNNQEVSHRVNVTVHKGDFYVGLRPSQYIGVAGEANQVELLAVDWQSKPIANQAVELIFAEQQWYSVQRQEPEPTQPSDSFYWDNLVDTVAVFTSTVTTDARGEAKATFMPKNGGSYKVYARAVDKNKRQIFSATYLWISGGGYINWGQANDDRLELVADKTEYNVGETAQILVPHPYSSTVRALVTLERGHVYSYSVVTLTTNSDQLPITITESLAPNIYVSVVVVQGSGPAPDPARVSRSQKILPSFKIGYVNLPINLAEKKLDIVMTPNKAKGETYLPGETVSYNVKVTNQGRPVKAELSLALIDKAVLTLAPEISGQLLETFWRQRGLGVQTGSPLTLAVDRINRVIDAKKGGGGGGESFGIDSVREKFADAPLWVAHFETDEQGHGSVEVTLPDNLTSWVLIGKGVTGADTRVGESRVEIVTTKPIIVRPVMPRFLVTGDQARAGMVIQNNSLDMMEVLPYFEAPGLTVKAVKPTETISLKAGEQVKVEYDLVAPTVISTTSETQTVKVTLAAKVQGAGNQNDDALTFELPIYHLSSPETVATAGILAEDGGRNEAIILPTPPITPPDSGGDGGRPQGNITIDVNPSLAAGTVAGLRYLENYPYQSTEAIVSRFLPNVVTYRAYKTLDLDKPKPTLLVNLAIQRLYRQQNADGGWGWWGGLASDPFLTAYVVLGMVEAQKTEFTVSADVINRATTYLQSSLIAPKDVAEPWQGNRQAFILYVLAEAGQADFSRAVALFDLRQQLDFYGRAYLALAMSLSDPTAKQIDTLLADLTAGAITEATGAHWEEAQTDFYGMNTDTRSTAIIIAALARLQPDNVLLPQAVRWLMSVRQHGGSWENTQETAWAIMGLTDWMEATGELQANYEWQVWLNGDNVGSGQANSENLTETTQLQLELTQLLSNKINYLSFERNPNQTASQGNLYYATYLTYFKTAADLTALDRGISVARQYREREKVDAKGDVKGAKEIKMAQVGELVEVQLTIIAPNDLHYVLVSDPFPAGMEAVDSSLATTSIADGQPELERTDRTSPWGDNYWFAHTELRDEKATLFAEYLPKGTYQYTYLLRAALPGQYQAAPTEAHEIYFPEVFGRGASAVFTVTE